jgi:hypothetical protein
MIPSERTSGSVGFMDAPKVRRWLPENGIDA